MIEVRAGKQLSSGTFNFYLQERNENKPSKQYKGAKLQGVWV